MFAPAGRGQSSAAPSASSLASVDVATTSSDVISFPPEVERAIEEVLPSDNPLDHPGFATVDYINNLFPTEQSLNNLDDVIADNRYEKLS